MASGDRARQRLVRDINAQVRTIDDRGTSWLAEVVPQLARLISADSAVAYRLDHTPAGLQMDFFHSVGMPQARFSRDFESFAQSKDGKYAAFDPVCPEPRQRNVALANDDIASISGTHPRSTSTYHEFFPRYGMERCDQLRALLCEGASLLAWVGGFRAGPFGNRERADLQKVLPDLRARLLLERRAFRTRLTGALVPVLLEAVVGPAFIIGQNGRVLEANSRGSAWLSADRTAAVEALRNAIHGDRSTFSAIRVDMKSSPVAWFVFQSASPPGSGRRFDQRIRDWRLTPRQIEVARLLSKGLSNKAIAAELNCAEKTVELHVTAVLRKAEVDSRAALLARIFERT